MGERRVVRRVDGRETSEGAGVRLRRTLGGPDIDQLDPFLLLDEFRSDQRDDYIAGFPDHPHRGFETVTYMLAGSMRHRDSRGNEGHLVAGSVQWMTAGRGLVHSEMPQQDHGLMWGFQLWVNLPAAEKMREPRYQDIAPERVPEVGLAEGARARVLAGRVDDVTGPVVGISTDPLYLDVRLAAVASVVVPVPPGHNAFAYVYDGAVEIGGTGVGRGQLAALGDGDAVRLRSLDAEGALLLVAGRPIGEPVARYGPFVMNTREQIEQAFRDYQNGRFGVIPATR
jgi:redox-sensitive bicupin YhaK (pirin superfamily)